MKMASSKQLQNITARIKTAAKSQINHLSLEQLQLTCLRGAFPPVDLRAVCLVRAMLKLKRKE